MSTAKPRKRFVGNKSATPSKPGISSAIANQIPQEILTDVQLNDAIAQLPSNYSFEIHKTIHHVRKNKVKMVALQIPEGLQMFACTIADIIERFTDALTVIMGDVTYGACCIDDYTAVALGCDMLVHYGHSCLVPMDQTTIKTLYVFVEISIDSSHLAQTVRLNFPDDRQLFHEALLDSEETDKCIPVGTQIGPTRHLRIEGPSSPASSTEHDKCGSSAPEPTRLALVSTIQFVAALQRLKEDITLEYNEPSHPSTGDTISDQRPKLWTGKYEATIPRSKPLSPGEILGCTAPQLPDVDALIYLGDGRFHLESIMIANPTVPAFRYDPYSKKLTRERYDHKEMQMVRDDAVQKARRSIELLSHDTSLHGEKEVWGVILGTLGRQGSLKQLQAITNQLETSRTPIPYMPILLSELSPAKLALFNPHISTFVQTSCPRLSIDWGYAFDRPLLSPYETSVAIGKSVGWMKHSKGREDDEVGVYPMDFYKAGSPWAIARTAVLQNPNAPNAVHIAVPPRFYLLPGSAIIIGSMIGLTRGSRRASLRFLAENVHRPPTTVQGWYFYNKTKNYKVILGGLKEAGWDAGRLGTTAAGWVGIEEGLERAGLGDVGEIGAGVGTAGVFSAVYRLPLRGAIRTLILGLMIGSGMRLLRWVREGLRKEVELAVVDDEQA